jgi:hypothetical protein
VGVSADEIVVERTWRNGIEMVSRVNWSHIARIRRALGLVDNRFGFGAASSADRLAGSQCRDRVTPAELRAA